VVFKDRDVTGWISNRIVELGLGLVPQGRRVFPSLSVRENLLVALKERKGPWTVDRVMELFPRLREREDNRAGKLSGGEQQMLAIARALVTNPDLLLMDEPTEGLAPLLVREVGRVIERLKGEGLSILLVEQNLPLALRIADHIHVLSRGRIVHSGPPAELEHNPEVSPIPPREMPPRREVWRSAAPSSTAKGTRLMGVSSGAARTGEVWRGASRPPPSQQFLQGG
jgi:branched-chain amino acid transport system ATP-binding protein